MDKQPEQEPDVYIPADALRQLKGTSLLILRSVPLYGYRGDGLTPLYTKPPQPKEPEQETGGLAAYVIGCFRAAEVEGLQEALAETTDKRLKDLVERRLMYALYEAQKPQPKEPEQEPVGSLSVRYHRGCKSMTNTDFDYNGDLPEGDYELYTTPPQRKWVGLSHDEDDECACKADAAHGRDDTFAWASVYRTAIEAKLKEKNTW